MSLLISKLERCLFAAANNILLECYLKTKTYRKAVWMILRPLFRCGHRRYPLRARAVLVALPALFDAAKPFVTIFRWS